MANLGIAGCGITPPWCYLCCKFHPSFKFLSFLIVFHEVDCIGHVLIGMLVGWSDRDSTGLFSK